MNMLETGEWVQQYNLHFLVEQLKNEEKPDVELSEIIEDVKVTELELWKILQSNLAQSKSDEEIV